MTEFAMSESIVVAATPDELYALVSDVTRTGEWSPICKTCWWDEGPAAQLGSWFIGRNETQSAPGRPGLRWWPLTPAGSSSGRSTMAGCGGATRSSRSARIGKEATRLTESWVFLPAGLAGFRERFGERADDEILARQQAAVTGIPATLAAIKRVAEAA